MQAEVVIVGAGLVGIAAAVALAKRGLRVALVDSRTDETATSPPSATDWDQRIYAITPGNKQWLEALDVWPRLDGGRVCSVDRMQVWGDNAHAVLMFDAYDASLPSLSFILEGRQLEQALWSRARTLGIEVLAGGKVTGLSLPGGPYARSSRLMLADGRTIETSLIVAADGGHSTVRQLAGLTSTRHAYEDNGVVANFECELAHGQVARQWFRDDGVLAWLPLPGQRISMVWSTPRHAELLAMDDATFCSTVAAAGAQTLGELRLISRPASFPLSLQSPVRLVLPGLVLIGDAAHQVHPLAGQGVNLGFRDVIELTTTLVERHANESLGDLLVLRRYERARKTDILAMRHVTHGLHELFAHPQPMLRRLRNLGLGLTDRHAWLKRQLIKHATI